MNSYIALFFLGLLQGLTEFLPVSSSGHLVLFSAIFSVEESLLLSIILHVATLLSIVCVFRRSLWHMVRHPFSKETISLAIATIATCLVVILIMPLVEMSFSGMLLPLCFLISAIILVFAEIMKKKRRFSCEKMSNKVALFMGIAQGLAVFPGISRSGATISAGMIAGADKSESAKFSFLMSIPIILLSLALEIYQIATGTITSNLELFPTLLAFVVAFLSGIFAIKFMIRLTEKASFVWFSVYLVMISIVALIVEMA